MLWLFVLLFGLCWSHELWIERVDGEYVLLYGHLKPMGGEKERLEYKPEQVISFECLDTEGKKIRSTMLAGYPARLKGNCSLVEAKFSSGYWTKTPEGLKNLPKENVKNPIESWYSVEIVRRIDTWTKAPLTHDLEIALLENPSSLKVGQKFTVVVYYRGKPLKDATIYHNGRIVGSTDEEGRINLRLRERGLQLIGTTLKEKDIKADYILKTFYLIFEVER